MGFCLHADFAPNGILFSSWVAETCPPSCRKGPCGNAFGKILCRKGGCGKSLLLQQMVAAKVPGRMHFVAAQGIYWEDTEENMCQHVFCQ